MRPEEHEARAVREWLDEAWRHGEIVAEQEGWLSRSAPRHPRAQRVAHQLQRTVRATRAVLLAAHRT